MIWIFLFIIVLILTIPVTGFVSFIRTKEYDMAAITAVIMLVAIALSYGLYGQLKSGEEFSNKCEQANGVVVRNQCFEKTSVIEIQR